MQRCILDVAIRTRSSIQEDKTIGYSSTYPLILWCYRSTNPVRCKKFRVGSSTDARWTSNRKYKGKNTRNNEMRHRKQSNHPAIIQLGSLINRRCTAGAERNSKLDSKSPVMKANSEVSKEMESEEDGCMRNENGMLSTRTRVIKKQNRFDNCVI